MNFPGILADIQSKLERPSVVQPSEDQVIQPATVLPYWEACVTTGLTLATQLTAGIDWDPLFDDPALADLRKFRYLTSAGEISPFGTHGLNCAKRFSIQWEAKQNCELDVAIAGFYTEASDTDWIVQVKMNGDITELFPSPTFFTLNVREGKNRLVLSYAERPILVTFIGLLFNGSTSRWVPPRN